MKCAKFQQILGTFNVGTNFGLSVGKYFSKTFFNFKIKFGIFEIPNVPNFNKFCAFLILGPILA